MKKNNYIISIIVCLLPILIGIILYNKLPSELPIHFNINNIPDNYASKNIMLFGIPIVMTAFQVIICVLINRFSKDINNIPKVAKVVLWIAPILTIMLYYLSIIYTLNGFIEIGKCVFLVLGMVSCVLGNYMPKMSYEGSKFMMHPASKDEHSFRKTTKITGYLLILLGFAFLIGIFFI